MGAASGRQPNKKDLFVELDYFSNLTGSAGTSLHSHLPKEAALNAVGAAFNEPKASMCISISVRASIRVIHT